MNFRNNLMVAVLALFLSFTAAAQSTVFTYQGSISVSGLPANGSYDMEFALFDAASAGTQVSGVLAIGGIQVANGSFTTTLNFGNAFPGAARFLEIRVRPTGGGSYTTLAPRQPFTSAPYAITASNAANLAGVAASQYVQTTDPRLSDARPPTAGSASYIQNGAGLQAASNFNISGTGSAGTITATDQFNLGSNRVLYQSNSSTLFIGNLAGEAVLPDFTTQRSVFVGPGSGRLITSGDLSTFVGNGSGGNTPQSFANTFVGYQTGRVSTGINNTFMGTQSGLNNTSGNANTAIGSGAGSTNTTGTNNTLLGASADVETANLSFATAIGAGSSVSTSNSIVLGRAGGEDAVRIPGPTIINGSLVVDTLGSTTGNTHLCRNTANRLSLCTSNFVEQSEADALKAEIEKQKAEIAALKAYICSRDKDAPFCKEKK